MLHIKFAKQEKILNVIAIKWIAFIIFLCIKAIYILIVKAF